MTLLKIFRKTGYPRTLFGVLPNALLGEKEYFLMNISYYSVMLSGII